VSCNVKLTMCIPLLGTVTLVVHEIEGGG